MEFLSHQQKYDIIKTMLVFNTDIPYVDDGVYESKFVKIIIDNEKIINNLILNFDFIFNHIYNSLKIFPFPQNQKWTSNIFQGILYKNRKMYYSYVGFIPFCDYHNIGKQYDDIDYLLSIFFKDADNINTGIVSFKRWKKEEISSVFAEDIITTFINIINDKYTKIIHKKINKILPLELQKIIFEYF